MICFNYNPLKAVQAAALLLKLHRTPMNYMKLLKLLYMCDRISLQTNDESITGDTYCSMKFGPVLSHIYNLIKGEGEESHQHVWDAYISRRKSNYQTLNDYTVKLLQDPGDLELSDDEGSIIEGVYSLYGKMDQFDLAHFTHLYFPEWHSPGNGATPIAVEDILRSVGKTPEEIAHIKQDVERENYIDRVLAA
jgi:uncharacterized phage-associated protein